MVGYINIIQQKPQRLSFICAFEPQRRGLWTNGQRSLMQFWNLCERMKEWVQWAICDVSKLFFLSRGLEERIGESLPRLLLSYASPIGSQSSALYCVYSRRFTLFMTNVTRWRRWEGVEQTKRRFLFCCFFPPSLLFWAYFFSASLSRPSSKIDRETRLSVHGTRDYFYEISTLLLLAFLYAE